MHPTRIFKSPEEVEIVWAEFKEDLKEQSKEWIKVQYVGKEGEKKSDPQKIPLTLEGFERFCYNKYGSIDQYFKNKDELYTDFIPVCSRIKNEIRENQIIGGMVGFFNPSITQRLNNLADTQNVNNSGDAVINVTVHKGEKP